MRLFEIDPRCGRCQQELGAAFTPEVAEAWAAMYGVVAGAMQRGAAIAAAA
ncbi:MAG TPA: hypothetical protein VML19_23340 [Verrucomicrobiae bacterium]|nr:hypothetical protein [Verrucomicrobiae bacterium]